MLCRYSLPGKGQGKQSISHDVRETVEQSGHGFLYCDARDKDYPAQISLPPDKMSCISCVERAQECGERVNGAPLAKQKVAMRDAWGERARTRRGRGRYGADQPPPIRSSGYLSRTPIDVKRLPTAQHLFGASYP